MPGFFLHNLCMNAKWMRVFIWACAVVTIAIIVGLVVHHFVKKRPFVFAGTLETTKVTLASRVAADISDIFVIEGDNVSVNQPLIKMSCDAYKILARQIDGDYDRATKLLERGHLSQAEYDVLTRNKQDNDLKLSWCNVSSPINGIVVTKFRQVGEVVAPGTVLISLANPYDIWAYFYVPYSMLHELNVGQDVVGFLPEAENAAARAAGRLWQSCRLPPSIRR